MSHTENNLYILEGLIIAEVLTLKEALTMLEIELEVDTPYISKNLPCITYRHLTTIKL